MARWKEAAVSGKAGEVEEKIDQMTAGTMQAPDVPEPPFKDPRIYEAYVVALEDEIKSVGFRGNEPIRIQILRVLLDGPQLRRNIVTSDDISVSMRLSELKRSASIAARYSGGRVEFSITNQGVVELARWLAKARGVHRISETLQKMYGREPGLDDFTT